MFGRKLRKLKTIICRKGLQFREKEQMAVSLNNGSLGLSGLGLVTFVSYARCSC